MQTELDQDAEQLQQITNLIKPQEGIELMNQPSMPLKSVPESQRQEEQDKNLGQLWARPSSASPRASPDAINVYQIELEERADPSRLSEMLKLNHPQRKNRQTRELQDFTCYDACCGTITGQHNCCSSSKDVTDVDEFGIGIALYFRFIKQIGCYYFCFLILSIPSILFGVISYSQQNSTDSSNFISYLMGTTIGAIGSGTKLCTAQQFENGTLYQNFQCQTGYLDFDNSFSVGIVNKGQITKSNCDYFTASQLDYSCKFNTPQNLNDTCNNQNNCSFSMSINNFTSNCTNNLTESYIYTNVFCKNSYIQFISYNLPKHAVPLILAGFDALIILLFIVMLVSLKAGEGDYINRIKYEEPQIQYFTLQFSNLPYTNLSQEQMKAKVWLHIQSYCRYYIEHHKIEGQENFLVYDVKISESQEQLILQRDIRIQELYIARKMRQFLKIHKIEGVNEQEITLAKLKLLEPKIHQKNRHQAQKQLHYIEKKFININQLKVQFDNIRNKPQEEIKYLWATFLTQEQASIASQAFQTIPSDKLMLYCCPSFLNQESQKQIIKNGKEQKFLVQKPASNPDNIIWENIYYSTTSRKIRHTITLLLTLALLLASFIVIVYINNKKNEMIAKYPSTDCSLAMYSDISDQQLRSNRQNTAYVQCYCSSAIKLIISDQLPGDIQVLCGEWFSDYTFLKVLPVVAVLCIILINVAIQYFFQFLSQFEKHEILSDEYTARVLKIFFAQFLNTALILLISNASFKLGYSDSVSNFTQFLMGGKYDDMNSVWYQNVGTVVLLTILINVITTPLFLVLEQMLKIVMRCCDRGCSLNMSVTGKKTMKELIELYSGPEFLIDLRYAQILNISFVCMMYGSGMPLLYFFTTITLTIIFWLDKIWLFLFYQTPINFDSSITRTARRALWVASVIHCGFAIFIYGNSNLFYDPNNKSLSIGLYNGSGYQESLWQRINFSYTNLILFAFFLLFIFLFMVTFLFVKPFGKLISSWIRYVSKPIGDPNFTKPITQFLKDPQLEREIKFLQYQIEHSKEPSYITLLKGRQQYLIDFLNHPKKAHSKDLTGMHSYDIAYNHKYEECIDWQMIEQTTIKEDEKPTFAAVAVNYRLVENDIVLEV